MRSAALLVIAVGGVGLAASRAGSGAGVPDGAAGTGAPHALHNDGGEAAQPAPNEPASGVATAMPSTDELVTAGARLGAVLGCDGCHGAPFGNAPAAPPLADAGRRYQASHVVAYLKAPVAVRPGVRPARMPAYPLFEGEAEAIAAYLSSLTGSEALPDVRGGRGRAREGAAHIEAAGCLACHTLDGTGAGTAVELADVAARLQRDWVRALLVDPDAVQPGTDMPALFYRRTDGGYREAGAAARLDAIVAYLYDRGSRPARSRNDARSIEFGRQLVGALACGACHRDLAPTPAPTSAPDLRYSVALMRDDALRSYLRSPVAVRPFGHPPGSGSRMPDFHLDEGEVAALAAWLRTVTAPQPAGALPAPLPRYARATAETLLRERLPCLGCHALDGVGGRVAPELGAVAARLEAAAIAAIIDDPAAHRPGSTMPRIPLSAYERRRVIGYLLGRDHTEAASHYLSPREHALLPDVHDDVPGAHSDYQRNCAACHGSAGDGAGFNARYLPAVPTAHLDPAYMSGRPDDSLLDAVAVGGRIMGRSAAMPMFGESLDTARLRALVVYMRELCACDPPSWSVTP